MLAWSESSPMNTILYFWNVCNLIFFYFLLVVYMYIYVHVHCWYWSITLLCNANIFICNLSFHVYLWIIRFIFMKMAQWMRVCCQICWAELKSQGTNGRKRELTPSGHLLMYTCIHTCMHIKFVNKYNFIIYYV